ncbi:hypothetical protein ABS735_08505 [Streptomyces sp. MMCC 100]|uniref:hypothetical protein n=1 Tax=Streptomyces sp. MMCC 100 TaxID=3163555 RepID=UPI00359876C5
MTDYTELASAVGELKSKVAAMEIAATQRSIAAATALKPTDPSLQYITKEQFDARWAEAKSSDDAQAAKEWIASPAGIKALESAAAKWEMNGGAAAGNFANLGLNGLGMSWDVVKLELPPLLDLSKKPTEWLGRVFPWILNENEDQAQLGKAMQDIQRLQDSVIRSHNTLRGNIRNSNLRIGTLERRMKAIRTTTRQTRSEVAQHSRPGSTTSEADRLRSLEQHVQRLAHALG